MRIALSYPKSGRTWLRFMIDDYLVRLHNLRCENVFQAEDQLRQVCPVEWTHLTAAMVMRRPYWAMGPMSVRGAEAAPWLLLTRDFRATLASAYFQARDRIRVFQGTPSQFLRDPRYGVIKLVTFYNLWELELRPQLRHATVLSYEAMQADPADALIRALEGLDLPIQGDLAQGVAAEATFDRMKMLATTPAYAGTVLAPTDPSRPQTHKVRSAGRDAAALFTDEDLAFIDRVVDDLLVTRDAVYYRPNRDHAGDSGSPSVGQAA